MAIIGLSGRKQVGKDLTASIIQYLVWEERARNGNSKYPLYSLQDLINNRSWRCAEGDSGWKVVKFADKLKDIICLILGCTREQLEDETFKNTPLGEEWLRWSFTGNLNQGNESLFDTEIEALLVAKAHYVYIKDHPENYSISYEQAIRNSIYPEKLNPRKILQILGTDCGRNMIHPSIWANSTMANYTNSSNWIISDVRFPSEVKAIHDKEGIVIRINRPSIVSTDQHESETALDDYDNFNYTIENSGSIEELLEKVKEILIKEKVIS